MNNRMEIVQSKTVPVKKISILFSSLGLRLSKLQKLTLYNCGLVKTLFPPSVAQQFTQLKELDISACRKMEYIVAEAKEEEKNKGISKIAFPNLTKVGLRDLPELVAFFADNDISFELCSLVYLKIRSCPKLKTHYCETPDSSTLNKEDVSKKKDMEMEQPSTSQMKSAPMEMISTLFFLPSSPLLNLRELHIGHCDFQEADFPVSVAQQLVQLKELSIWSCEKMEYIVAKDKGRGKIVLFPSLTYLHLSDLPNLMGFCKDNNVSLEWSLVEELSFVECPKMKTFCVSVPKSSTLSTSAEVDHLDSTPRKRKKQDKLSTPRKRKKQDNNFSKEVSLIKNQRDPSVSNIDESCAFPSKLIQQLQNLKDLWIEGSDSVEVIFSFEGLINGVLNSVEEICLVNLPNLKHVWFKIPPEVTAFQNLRELIVIDCDNLINLFSICSAKLVGKLQSIEIRRCNRMEEIIGKEDEEISKQKIVFPQLRSLTLEDLPNFNSFCNRIYALELPFLETLKFLNWKRTETFFYGSLSMPKLEKVMINRRLHQLMGSDPNLNAKMSELLKMNQ